MDSMSMMDSSSKVTNGEDIATVDNVDELANETKRWKDSQVIAVKFCSNGPPYPGIGYNQHGSITADAMNVKSQRIGSGEHGMLIELKSDVPFIVERCILGKNVPTKTRDLQSKLIKQPSESVEQQWNLSMKTRLCALSTFRFLDLPMELRDTIYEFVLDTNRHLNITFTATNAASRPQWSHLYRVGYLPMLLVNHQINLEARAVLYRNFHFKFSTLRDFVAFMQSIGQAVVHVRHITIKPRHRTTAREIFNAVELLKKVDKIETFDLYCSISEFERVLDAPVKGRDMTPFLLDVGHKRGEPLAGVRIMRLLGDNHKPQEGYQEFLCARYASRLAVLRPRGLQV